MEVIISPLGKYPNPYLHRIRKAEQIKWYPFNTENNTLTVEVGKAQPDAEMELVSRQKPQSVSEIDNWAYSDNTITLKLDSPVTVQFSF